MELFSTISLHVKIETFQNRQSLIFRENNVLPFAKLNIGCSLSVERKGLNAFGCYFSDADCLICTRTTVQEEQMEATECRVHMGTQTDGPVKRAHAPRCSHPHRL